MGKYDTRYHTSATIWHMAARNVRSVEPSYPSHPSQPLICFNHPAPIFNIRYPRCARFKAVAMRARK
jgi:hypothetical protein